MEKLVLLYLFIGFWVGVVCAIDHKPLTSFGIGLLWPWFTLVLAGRAIKQALREF